mgnify:CR=1 FL=1
MASYPKPLTIQCTKNIIEQMESSLYKINENKEKFDIGFFIYIKNKNKKISVFITNYHVTSHGYNNAIKVSLNNISTTIEFGDARCNNKEYGISLIEIKDSIKDKLNFFEIDDILFENNSEIYYEKDTMYAIYYNNKNNIVVSYDIINSIYDSGINYNCNTKNSNSTIFPIFNSFNNKIIGIQNHSNIHCNKGIFLKLIIKEFINTIVKNP